MEDLRVLWRVTLRGVNGLSENRRFADPNGEIIIFSKVSDETDVMTEVVTEVARIKKVNGADVFEIVDQRILSKFEQNAADAAGLSKLTEDMVAQPALLKAVGDEPELVDTWKTLKDAQVDDALRNNPKVLEEVRVYCN